MLEAVRSVGALIGIAGYAAIVFVVAGTVWHFWQDGKMSALIRGGIRPGVER